MAPSKPSTNCGVSGLPRWGMLSIGGGRTCGLYRWVVNVHYANVSIMSDAFKIFSYYHEYVTTWVSFILNELNVTELNCH